jgi:hypothetical protein
MRRSKLWTNLYHLFGLLGALLLIALGLDLAGVLPRLLPEELGEIRLWLGGGAAFCVLVAGVANWIRDSSKEAPFETIQGPHQGAKNFLLFVSLCLRGSASTTEHTGSHGEKKQKLEPRMNANKREWAF